MPLRGFAAVFAAVFAPRAPLACLPVVLRAADRTGAFKPTGCGRLLPARRLGSAGELLAPWLRFTGVIAGLSAPRAVRLPGPMTRAARGAGLSRVGVGAAGSARGTPGRARLVGAGLPSAASFLGGVATRRRIGVLICGASAIGRQSTSILPIDCTNAQPSRWDSSVAIAARAARSSPCTRTLMRPCEFSARSVSAPTASVSPASPIMTTGDRAWACARSALRSAELRMGTGPIESDKGSKSGAGRALGREGIRGL